MAFMLSVRRFPAISYLASMRRFCSNSQSEEFLQKITSLIPSVVAVRSSFDADDREYPHSCRGGIGVLLDPRLIVTSAHTVGRVDTVSEEKGEHWSVLHKSYIGSSAAYSVNRRQALETRPVAVNFGNDVAILEVLNAIHDLEGCSPRLLADSPLGEGGFLSNVSLEQHTEPGVIPLKVTVSIKLGRVRAVGARTIRAKAPWPMDDGLGWIEHDCDGVDYSDPVLKKSRDRVRGSITRLTGSPLFGIDGKVVGISSWEVRDEGAQAQHLVGFAVPQSAIRSALEYAQTKRPEDPIVMDHWISSHV